MRAQSWRDSLPGPAIPSSWREEIPQWTTSDRTLLLLAALFLHGTHCLYGASVPPPAEALKRMKTADGFEVRLVASEPEIRQPLSISFDGHGRMWVLQYLQYPNPAGLKPINVDQYLRTTYDRVPEPPPRGPKGADRITICEDTNGDGRYDNFKDFVAGLNLASGFAIGYGGVFVAQPPYLLFYPDRNRDDLPDGDPEVLLAGFGMEDAHAFANSLTWGPDGWLYGAHGSTVTANIRGVGFQQGIWRYHPLTKEFELFAEGGGNTWGLDFDEEGSIIAGTNFGERIGLHQVQGAYYVKGFAKHGPLHNPYTYGYFEHMPFKGFKGGHVTCGGMVYQGGAFPPQFRGAYIAGNLLANTVYWHVLEADGSSFKGHFGGTLLETDDVTFRPVDVCAGPDGAVYVADWCDPRATHVDSVDNWDKSNGRIYKIETKEPKRAARFDLSRLSSRELVELLANDNDWFRREARRLLAEKRDPKTFPLLRDNILKSKDPRLQLQSLWALYVSGGFSDALAAKLLQHPNANVRAWTVRFLGDARRVSSALQTELTTLAQSEPIPGVRNQLACSAKRLPGKDALPIVRELLHHDDDVDDPQIPLLLWWAIEAKAVSDRARVLALLDSAADWHLPMVRQHILERLARRCADEDTEAGYETCARLLAAAPGAEEIKLVLRGMDKGFEGRRLEKVSPALGKAFDGLWNGEATDLLLVRLGLRLNHRAAQTLALRRVADSRTAEAERISLIETLGETGQSEAVPVLLALPGSTSAKVQAAGLMALQRFSDPEIARVVLERYPSFSPDLRQRSRNMLVSRPAWSLGLVNAVESGRIEAKDLSLEQLRQMTRHNDPQLTTLIEKRWGRLRADTAADKTSAINRLKLVLSPSGVTHRPKGDATEGRKVFQQFCGICHKLFGEGNEIGPELTGADRRNTDFLLTNIVDPSAYIRPEYVNHNVEMKDGRSLSGLLVESTPQTVTLLDAQNQRTILNRADFKALAPAALSLMPEGIIEALTPEQVRNLFSYLQTDVSK